MTAVVSDDALPDRHLRAVIAYEGTDFHGFQLQVGQRSVQGELEQALQRVAQQPVRVLGAGRTDAGVHARGQVITFRLRWRHTLVDLQRAMNAVLPEDVVVLSLETAAEGFHPRYSARSRCYRYTVLNQPLRSPLDRRWVYQVASPLDVEAMNRAAAGVIGEHDFATFGRAPQGENTVRQVRQAGWTAGRPFLYFDIEANAFLHRMVRRLVGTMLLVGTGAMSCEEFVRRFEAGDRSMAGPAAPPQGLCLMAVNY